MSSALSNKSKGMTNYLNTLIFSIIAKGITVLLLVLLLFKPVRKYAYLILTIEVCLVVIIAAALITISNYEKDKAKQNETLLRSKVEVTSCPDYFIKDVTGDGTICKNTYTTPDGRFTYTFGGKPINLDTTFQNKTFEQSCAVTTEGDFKLFSWTDLKTKCDSF